MKRRIRASRGQPETTAKDFNTEPRVADFEDGEELATTNVPASKKGSEERPLTPDHVSPAISMESNCSHILTHLPGAEALFSEICTLKKSSSVSSRTLCSNDAEVTTSSTWNHLIKNIEIAVERYCSAIKSRERSEYVRRAENILDHLRLLLAAGSGNIENRSTNIPISPAKQALFIDFGGIMSNLAKLLLFSHIAAADWPRPEFYTKCLREADGILQETYKYARAARQQKGEFIQYPPVGVMDRSAAVGIWRDNRKTRQCRDSLHFMDQDEYEPFDDPTIPLTSDLVEALEMYRKTFIIKIRGLDGNIAIPLQTSSSAELGNNVCLLCGAIFEYFRPWIQTVESINLTLPGNAFQSSQFVHFSSQRELLFDVVSKLFITCQAVAEYNNERLAEFHGDARLNHIGIATRQFETLTNQVRFSLRLLLELMPKVNPGDILLYVNESKTLPEIGKHPKKPMPRSGSMENISSPFLSEIGLTTRREGFEKEKSYAEVEKYSEKFSMPDLSFRIKGYKFLHLDHEKEISYDTNVEPPQIRGGTLEGLVEQLTRHDRLDSHFNDIFLMTYRLFTNGVKLFDMLVSRFHILPPVGLSREDMQTWVDQKQKVVRLRVVNILKKWIDSFWMEENDDTSRELLHRIYIFGRDAITMNHTPSAMWLDTAVLKQRVNGERPTSRRVVATSITLAPLPILPKNMNKLEKIKFLDIDATEFARQLTIIESGLYRKIEYTECLKKVWQKKAVDDGEALAPNIKNLILHSNRLTNWVAEMILNQPDIKKRVSVIKHFIVIADKCRLLNNFSAQVSIVSAFATAPVQRLARTWLLIVGNYDANLDSMRQLVSSTKNFRAYRESLHLANPPCIPFLGVYLTDLTFINEAIPTFIKNTKMINFTKLVKFAEFIYDIEQYQNVTYPLRVVPELQQYILTKLRTATDASELFERSLQIEPRETQTEITTRWAISCYHPSRWYFQ